MVFVKNKKVLVFLFLLVFFLSWANLVLAVEPPKLNATNVTDKLEESAESGFDVQSQGVEGGLLVEYIGSILKMVIAFLGVIFFLLIIYAGWLWMSAQGNEEQVEKAKKVVSSAIFGLALVLFAGTIAVVVFALLKQQSILVNE